MLRQLELRDFALISRLELSFGPGFSVLTGETGAGKSILVDALLQLAGARADSGLVRSGADSTLIQAEFKAGPDGSPLTLSRRLQQGGRSSARIDGEVVTVTELGRRAAPLIGIHGQHASLELADGARHLRLLDRLLPESGVRLLEQHGADWLEWREATSQLAALQAALQERARRLDTIGFQLNEIRAAGLRAGEEEELRASLSELRNAGAVASAAGQAQQLLSEADEAVITLLAAAARQLDTVARYSRALEPLAAELQQSLTAVQATATEVESFLADFDADPRALERAEARLALLEGLQRKYGQDTAEILDYAAALEAEQQQLEQADDEIGRLQQAVTALEDGLVRSAAQLTALRLEAAARLEAGLAGYLEQLGMAAARFEVRLEPLDAPGRSGSDRVQFLFSANPGEPLRDLNEVASGGELSRLLLALHLVAGADQPVLVFDEIDAGTGGRAAVAIGRLLRQLATERQVLVVTHLPQVAAFAHEQYVVSKAEHDGRTVSTVRHLTGSERAAELARMLSGNTSEASLRAATEMLESAAAVSPDA